MLPILLLACLLAPNLLAHGGAYSAPGNAGADAGSSGGAPSALPGGSSALPPANAGSAGPAVGAPAAAGGSRGSSGRTGSTRSGSASGGGAALGLGKDGWEFWWQANRDRYVRLRSQGAGGQHAPGSPGLLTARGAKSRSSVVVRPGPEWVEQTALPALLELSASVDDRNILDSALIAMGRAAPADLRAEVGDAARRLLAHRELSVQGAAALSLGIVGASDATELLEGLLRDDSRGRAAVGGGNVPDLVRAFASLALGLLGEAGSTRTLMAAAVELPDAERDVKSCVLASLGLLEPGSSQAATAADLLRELLDDRRMDPAIQAMVPTTLGKLGCREALPRLAELLADGRTPDPVRQSCAIALGSLAGLDDVDATRALERVLRHERDQLTRCFSWVALAQLGARDQDRRAGEESHDELVDQLAEQVLSNDRHRSWAALGAALYGRAHPDQAQELIGPLRAAFADEHDPSFRGAFALALALLEDRRSGVAILASLEESRQDDYRGHAAEALGLLRHGDAAPALRQICQDPSLPETVRLKAATGLGLLGDGAAVPVLLEGLEASRSLAGLSSMATALGLIGDARVGAPLISMARDEQRAELSRAFATVALGLLGERDALPFNASLREQINYLVQTPTMTEVLRIL